LIESMISSARRQDCGILNVRRSKVQQFFWAYFPLKLSEFKQHGLDFDRKWIFSQKI
jgi:hypothetical protein